MQKKFSILYTLIILIIAATFCSFAAEDDVAFRVYNPKTTTSDLDATYIQGDINQAKGQKIVVTNHDGFVAEKILPNTGGMCSFRIKMPKSSISTDKTTSYAVTVFTPEGKEIKTAYVRVEYKAKRKQRISVNEKEYNLIVPGTGTKIKAKSSSGMKLTYSSSDEKVAKVDSKGNIEPIGGGTAIITVSQSNNSKFENASESIKVSIKELPYFTVRFHLGKDIEDNQNKDFQEDRIVEQKIAVSEATKLLAANDKKGDYEFLGWATTATGYPEYDNAEEVKGIAKEDETLDLYAVWHGERAQKAIDWAVQIADDNRFTYGKGYGGYFNCCVCAGRTSKHEDAQYTCMPFLAAAYAHGPDDPIMMSGGKHVMNLHDGNFKGELGKVWEKVGLCSNLTFDDLRPGDVIIKYSGDNSHGHAWMYIGDDQYVDATPKSNENDDIAVRSGAQRYFNSYRNGDNFVMRYKF